MVRDNWETKSERAEARRNETKQRKQRSEEKRIFKTMVQELLALLELHGELIRQRFDGSCVIHVWTNCLPSDAECVLDMCDGREDMAGKRRNRSGSIESEGSTSRTSISSYYKDKGGKRRSRSGSIESEGSPCGASNFNFGTSPNSKKKFHFRRKETPEPTSDETNIPNLCRSHFFTGKCDESRSGKKGGCRHMHYSKKVKTLAAVLESKTLSVSEAAFAETLVGDNGTSVLTAMDMIYYFPIHIFPQDASSQDSSLSDLVVSTLAKKSCPLASIIYVAINDVLLFDRYRDGLVVPEANFLDCVIGEGTDEVGLSTSVDEKEKATSAILLPGTVLEYILTFLPDAAVAASSSVCRAWHNEIGKVSGFLWRHLLNRRGWPLPDAAMLGQSTQVIHDQEQSLRFREAFVSHYRAVRDIKALRSGISGLITKRQIDERESCYHSLSARKGTTYDPNCCVGIEVWSPNHILVAYSHDCTLRLFNTAARGGSSGGTLCRELVCQSLDPYKNTKRRNCRIVAMALDEELIGGLCHVMADDGENDGFILTVLSREDFLVGESSNDGDCLKIIDISQSVLNYLLSCDEVDHKLLALRDFMAWGGEFDEVEVLVSQSVAGFGYGRFMLEVAISIPAIDAQDDDDSHMTLLFQRLFLFSASIGAIIWMGDSRPLADQTMVDRHEEMILTSYRTENDGSEGIGSKYAVISSSSCAITSGSIEPNGQMYPPFQQSGSREIRTSMLDERWEAWRRNSAVMMESQVAVADTVYQERENGEKYFKSVLSFHSLLEESSVPSYTTIHLDGNLEVDRLTLLRDDHIVALCRQYSNEPGLMAPGGATGVSVLAIIIHISSCREISRICLIDDLSTQLNMDGSILRDIPIRLGVIGGTVAAGVCWKGVVMAGEDMRSVVESSSQLSRVEQSEAKLSKKKKKKKAPRKGGKKDGFARGISLRG